MPPDQDTTTTRAMAAQPRSLALPALRRVLIYGFVGVAVSLFYSLAVIAFIWMLRSISPTIASVMAFVITVPAAYFAHAKITFPDSSHDKFQPLRFALSTTTSFIVAAGGMTGSPRSPTAVICSA